MKNIILFTLILSAVSCNPKSAVKSSSSNGDSSTTNPITALDASTRPETGMVCWISTFRERKPFFVRGMRDPKNGLTLHEVQLNDEYEDSDDTYSEALLVVEGRTIGVIKDPDMGKKFITGKTTEDGLNLENEKNPGNPIVGYIYNLKLPFRSNAKENNAANIYGEITRNVKFKLSRGLFKGHVTGEAEEFANVDECRARSIEVEKI